MSSSYIAHAAIEKLQSLDVACSINPLVPYAFREYFNATVPHLIVELETEAVRIDDAFDTPLLHPLAFEPKLEALTQIAEWSSSSSVQALLNLCAQEGLTDLAQVSIHSLSPEFFQTPFDIACANGHSQIVQLLMSAPDKHHGFISAIENKHLTVIKQLLPFVPDLLRGNDMYLNNRRRLLITSYELKKFIFSAEDSADSSEHQIKQKRFFRAVVYNFDERICTVIVSNALITSEFISWLIQYAYIYNNLQMLKIISRSARFCCMPQDYNSQTRIIGGIIRFYRHNTILEDACYKQNEPVVEDLIKILLNRREIRMVAGMIDKLNLECKDILLECLLITCQTNNANICRIIIDNFPMLSMEQIVKYCDNIKDQSFKRKFITHFIDSPLISPGDKRQLLQLRGKRA